MMKEGESGRKKINEYTRYATVVLCLVQSCDLGQLHDEPEMDVVSPQISGRSGMASSACCIMTAGTIFLMWIGEQIDEYGIGNGISLLIMAGILARMPQALAGRCCKNSTPKLTAGGGQARDRSRSCSCWRSSSRSSSA